MDKEGIEQLYEQFPLMIRMNDGREYVVDSLRDITCAQNYAYVLYREESGRLRSVLLPYVSMSAVEPDYQATAG